MMLSVHLTAFELVQAWGRQAQLRMVDDAGHSAFEPGVIGRLMRGLDEIAQQVKKLIFLHFCLFSQKFIFYFMLN